MALTASEHLTRAELFLSRISVDSRGNGVPAASPAAANLAAVAQAHIELAAEIRRSVLDDPGPRV